MASCQKIGYLRLFCSVKCWYSVRWFVVPLFGSLWILDGYGCPKTTSLLSYLMEVPKEKRTVSAYSSFSWIPHQFTSLLWLTFYKDSTFCLPFFFFANLKDSAKGQIWQKGILRFAGLTKWSQASLRWRTQRQTANSHPLTAQPTVPLRQVGRGAKRRRGWIKTAR